MEYSGCGDECRRTAIFYKALRCIEVVGLARVERIPLFLGSLPSYIKSATISYRTPCRRLLTDSVLKQNK
jgi:hypothetical protein